jgi:hypothetical protein
MFLKFLKVLKNITCFGQHGHPQVLKFLVGETAAILLLLYVHNTPSTVSTQTSNHTIQRNFTYKNSNKKKIFTHVTDICAHRRDTYNSSKIAAVSPTKSFNT